MGLSFTGTLDLRPSSWAISRSAGFLDVRQVVGDKRGDSPHVRAAVTEKRLKILHLGNVANYAYNVAKVLRTPDIESHALSWDYYHINARPEWEEADFDSSTVGNHYFPAFPGETYRHFQVPEWYSHGQMKLSALYLIARNEGKHRRARLIRAVNARYLRRIADADWRERQAWLPTQRIIDGFCLDLMGEGRTNTLRGLAAVLRGWRKGKPEPVAALPPPAAAPVQAPADAAAPAAKPERPLPWQTAGDVDSLSRIREVLPDFDPTAGFDRFVFDQISAYQAAYPARPFNPYLLLQFHASLPLMRRLFQAYDLVIGYAIEGIWPLVAGVPYMAYEFGTIRNIPFTDNDQGRLGFLAYRNAARTIVTNCDVRSAAEALRLDYVFLPHIINEGGRPSADQIRTLRQELESRFGGDFFVFHPARQHWGLERDTNWDKGNDHFFRGFADLLRTTAPNARCIAVEWGESLGASKQLAQELGISEQVIWIKPQPHASMMRYIGVADVIADQFTITTFGGIPPKAFFMGKPVISAFDPELHRWCFTQLPPIEDCRSPEQVSAALARLHADNGHRAAIGAAGEAWYRAFNSNERIRDILAAQVRDVIAGAASHSR